jgi:threonine/homoserine/homoserine lactone efflux protein
VATVSLNLTPGLDMMYVISRSVGQGRKAGVVSAFGIGAGTVVHIAITALGLTVILMTPTITFNIIRYSGALYLAYLGLNTMRKPQSVNPLEPSQTKTLARVFSQGVLTNVLNPKVALFFLAFLPQFVDQTQSVIGQVVLLGTIFDISGTTVNIIVALLSAHAAAVLLKKGRGITIMQRWLPGSILLGLALLVALT